MKSVIKILLILMIMSSFGAVYAGPNGTGNVSDGDIKYPMDPSLLFSYGLAINSPTTAQVNDTVQIVVTATNMGLVDWCPVLIYMPLPPDTQFVSLVVPDRNMQNYDPSTGIWNVYRMRHIERGQQKTAILTVKILDSAAGKKLTAITRFNQLVLEGYGVDVTDQTFARSTSINVKPLGGGPGNGGNTSGDTPGNDSGTNPNENDNGNGQDPVTVPGLNGNILGNSTMSSDNIPIKSLQSGGAGGGNGNPQKSFEINQIPPISKDNMPSYLIAVLLIIGMIVAGYYYGMKKED
ncbi:MAG: DUF11 domain-containing protein [Methanobacterium sp.]|nr:DUF11 domain-containing protein [Methanobacterium sp.]